jgi:transcriptional regulator with XRE-family HTH domain
MDVQIDGELIRLEREKRAWSQEHLAGAAGIGVRTVQRIEATGTASYESARAISAALGMSVSALRRRDIAEEQDLAGAPATVVRAPAARLKSSARWLGLAAALALLAGTTGFFLLHDYQQVRVLRTFEQWVTEPPPAAAQR